MKPLTHADLATADERDLLTIAETADALGVTAQTIRNWIRDNRLPATRIQRRLHVLLPHASQLEHDTRRNPRGRPRATR